MYKLYILYSTKDFKIRYVGITSKLLKVRLNEHLKNYKKLKTHKEKWINNSLLNNYEIRIKQVSFKTNKLEIKESEINLITLLRNKNYNLTNATYGGDGLLNPSSEVRLKMSKARKLYKWKDESRLKLSNLKLGKPSPTKGLVWKIESRLKLSNSKKGKPSNNQKIVFEYNLEGVFIKKWNNITEAAKYYDIVVSSITNNLKGLSKTCNKSIWKYE